MNIFFLIDIIFLLLIITSLFLFITMLIKNKKNKNYPITNNTSNPSLAILIPARDESKVINDLLLSIKKQTYKVNMEDVYIIIEDKEDPTFNIAKEYKANVIIRKNLNLRRKGYALDEAVKYILSKRRYDIYFIFDADNVLEENYIKEMLITYRKGYDIGVGYRNTKNGNYNVVSSSSSLTFSMINTIGNKKKNKETKNVTISGTGFYINGKYIDKWKGYPFHTLTEDYELTLYSTLNNMTSYYNEKAIFYDEQPTSFKVSISQRTRWIKGYFEARKMYVNKLYKASLTNNLNSGSQFSTFVGIKPYLLLVIGILLELIVKLFPSFYFLIFDRLMFKKLIIHITILLLLIYLILMIFTIIMLYKEKNKINLNKKSIIKSIFFNPIFLASYVICAIKALFNKNLEWEKINHG